jgi:hypothetical protein
MLCMDIYIYHHTITTTNIFPDFGELSEQRVIDALNQYHLICDEAVNHFRLHPTFILYI